MTIFEMMEQSGILTVLGMIVVFVFLWIMIVLLDKNGKDEDAEIAEPAIADTGVPQRITAAIAAAVNEYQKNESRS